MKTKHTLRTSKKRPGIITLRTGFTLLEMITAMCIVLVLVSLLLCSIGAARERTRQTQCAHNQKNLAQSAIMFALDNEHMPMSLAEITDWTVLPESAPYSSGSAYADNSLSPYYNSNVAITRCPKVQGTILDAQPVYSYGLMAELKGINYHRIQKPSKTVIIVDSDYPVVYSSDQVAKRHRGGAVAAFADGHITWFKEIDMPVIEESEGSTGLFEIVDGSVVLETTAMTTVTPLIAQYSIDSYNWYDVYIVMEILTAYGQTVSHDVIDPESAGINGEMSTEELADFSWESPEMDADSSINIVGTAKYWVKEWQLIEGEWQEVWVQTVKRQWNTEDDLGSQVWVLADGDPVPDIPGLNGQISVSEAVQEYVTEGTDGNDYISLNDNQVIYFFELGQTNPYYEDGSANPGYDCNDLVVLMEISTM